MSEKKKHSGFLDYLETGKFTDEFIHDFNYWCKRIYKYWKYLCEYDDFYENCWEALLSKIDQFDPNIATFQTFCISRINNEALRIYMKNKNHSKITEIDCDDPVIQADLIFGGETEVYLYFDGFVKYAESMGVTINIDEFYADYKEEKITPAMLAFSAWSMKNNEVGGRNDIFKRK